MTKILGRTSAGKIFAVCVDDDGHLQIDPLYLAEDDESNLVIPLADGGRQLIVRPDHDEKMWGYVDVLLDTEYTYNVDAGNGNIAMTHVPAGEIWIVYEWGVEALQTNCSELLFKKNDGSLAYTLKAIKSWTAGVTEFLGHPVVLKTGEYLQLRYIGASANDDFEMVASGYKMKAP